MNTVHSNVPTFITCIYGVGVTEVTGTTGGKGGCDGHWARTPLGEITRFGRYFRVLTDKKKKKFTRNNGIGL